MSESKSMDAEIWVLKVPPHLQEGRRRCSALHVCVCVCAYAHQMCRDRCMAEYRAMFFSLLFSIYNGEGEHMTALHLSALYSELCVSNRLRAKCVAVVIKHIQH